MRHEINLTCGRLSIDTEREAIPLEELLAFATRRNPRRGFLFVSKVLGKHIPCRPRAMRAVHEALAERLPALPGPVLVIGMAETATALGAGVAESYAAAGSRDDVIHQHTTRHALAAPQLVRFDEAHSHAPDHIVYAPEPSLASDYGAARSLVLVDDEITTGRTLERLTRAMLPHLPQLRRLVWVSIANWLDRERAANLRGRLGMDVHFASLLEGTFAFEPEPDFQVELPPKVAAHRIAEVRDDTGRRGVRAGRAPTLPQAPALAPGTPIHVVGTGEFGYQPFLLGEWLEGQGYDVTYQSTTRSPILTGEAIAASLAFDDEHGEGVANYLHNPPAPGGQVLVVYEAPHCAANHDLPAQLEAVIAILPGADRAVIV